MAGARHERRLLAVACMPLLGAERCVLRTPALRAALLSDAIMYDLRHVDLFADSQPTVRAKPGSSQRANLRPQA